MPHCRNTGRGAHALLTLMAAQQTHLGNQKHRTVYVCKTFHIDTFASRLIKKANQGASPHPSWRGKCCCPQEVDPANKTICTQRHSACIRVSGKLTADGVPRGAPV